MFVCNKVWSPDVHVAFLSTYPTLYDQPYVWEQDYGGQLTRHTLVPIQFQASFQRRNKIKKDDNCYLITC